MFAAVPGRLSAGEATQLLRPRLTLGLAACALLGLALLPSTASPTDGTRIVVDGFESGHPEGWSSVRGGTVQRAVVRSGRRALRTTRGRRLTRLTRNFRTARSVRLGMHLRVTGGKPQTFAIFRRNRIALITDGGRGLHVAVRGQRIRTFRLARDLRRWQRLTIELRSRSNLVVIFLGRRRVARISARIRSESTVAVGDLDRRPSGPAFLDNVSVMAKDTPAGSGRPGGGAVTPGAPSPFSSPSHDLFATGSPWNTPIPDRARVDPRSEVMVESIVDARRTSGFVAALRQWTVPVFFADADTPRRDVALTASWAPHRTLRNVPIPPGARPDPRGDGHMTVIDRARGCEFDFWQARQAPGGGWSASWANGLRTGGAGSYRGGLSARGSGFANLAGLVWPEELAEGRIDHALLFAYPHAKTGGPVWPATTSDGSSSRPDAIPQGARVQLDPHLDLDKLGLSRETRIIARAMQEYGMILGDNGGALSIYAIHPYSFAADPWRRTWPGTDFADLSAIPVERFRVLALGPQRARDRFEPEADGCARMVR